MELMQKKITIIFLSTILVRIIFHWLTNFTFDDAFITFRYVENLAIGDGFVYNKGEHVLGTTTPLFTLLLSMVHVIGFKVQQAATLVALMSSGITAVLIYKFACSLRMNHFAFVPVLLYILFPRLLVTDTAGMETSFFTLLIITSMYYSHKEKHYYAWGMATLASLTRPEGFLLLLLLGIKTLIQNREELIKLLAIPFSIIAPWFLFSNYYFGSVIPNSITAKLALYSQFGSSNIIDKLFLILNIYNYYGIVLILLAGIGAYWLWKKQNFGLLALVWLGGMILPLAVSNTALFIWYVSPIYPIYFLFIGAGFIFLIEKIQNQTLQVLLYKKIIFALICLLLLPMVYMKVSYYKLSQHNLEKVHKQIGYYLYTHTSEDEIIAAEDIGYIGYYSKRKILDRDGLVSPEAVIYNRSGKYFELVADYKPDWVVLYIDSPISRFYNSSKFMKLYEKIKCFSSDEITYCCYSKR